MGLVHKTLIGRLAEQMPEVREDIQRDVARILTTMPIESSVSSSSQMKSRVPPRR